MIHKSSRNFTQTLVSDLRESYMFKTKAKSWHVDSVSFSFVWLKKKSSLKHTLLFINVGAWVHSCLHCVWAGICVWCKYSSLYFSMCVCVKRTFSSHQTDQAPVPDSEVSHSLIILTFLHNDSMHNSPFLVFFFFTLIHLAHLSFPFHSFHSV